MKVDINNLNSIFTTNYLALVMVEVRKHTSVQQRKDAWTYRCMKDHWEFHGPDNFYWHGSADGALDARAKGWDAWLNKFHGEEAKK